MADSHISTAQRVSSEISVDRGQCNHQMPVATHSWELVADSICTKNRQDGKAPNIPIPAGVHEVQIGRGVPGQGCLPMWPQISVRSSSELL